MFAVNGTNLAGTGGASGDPNQGLPLILNGASLSVTVGSTTVHPALYSASPTQLVAEMPAGTPVGSGTLTVNNGSGNVTVNITIVASAWGFYTTTGAVTATDAASGAAITVTQSAQPGQALNIQGTGLGSDPQDSDTNTISSPHAINTPFTLYIGGVQIPSSNISFAGSSSLPGHDVITVTLPSNVPTGCYVSVVIVTGSSSNLIVSNTPVLSIMPTGGVCNSSVFGISGTTISTLGGQSTVRGGSLIVGQGQIPSLGTASLASGNFSSTTGTNYNGGAGSFAELGGCVLNQTPNNTGGGTSTSTPLDAGVITLKGPAGTYTLNELSKGSYNALLPPGAITQAGGSYVFSNGSGGPDIGPFSVTVTLPNPLLTWTNQAADATITRSQGVLIQWTGGASGTYVFIFGSSSANGVSGSFFCFAPQSALQFQVPAYITSGLPAGSGSLTVDNITGYSTFTATGLNNGVAFGFGFSQIAPAYQ
ncbi:MAG TPA: hypothetical protein VKS01_02195 [Bryobacteraceae bacterium]|nr:hypothetical protein [Bryobacteraceae bacterium]